MSSSGISQPRKMRGWLKKVSGIVNKTWVARFFVLTGESLDYYSSEECAKLLGTIGLADTRVREIVHDTEKYAFEIRTVSEKQKSSSGHEFFVLAASNANERQTWITALRRTIHYAGGCFGRPLAEQMKIEKLASVLKRRGSDFETPLIVRRCLDFLIEHNAVERDGIFRVGGRIKVQRDLRDEFDHGVDVDFSRVPDCDVAEVSSLLKSYLQSLPDSLIPARYFDQVAPLGCQIQTLAQQKETEDRCTTDADSEGERHENEESESGCQMQAEKRIEDLMGSLRRILTELPFDSFNLLHAIMHFLWLIHSHAETNRMTAANLAITCWQIILKPEDSTAEMMEIVADISIRTVTIMIERFRDLFGEGTCDAVRERHKSENESQSDARLHLPADTFRAPSDNNAQTRTPYQSSPLHLALSPTGATSKAVNRNVSDVSANHKSFVEPTLIASSDERSEEAKPATRTECLGATCSNGHGSDETANGKQDGNMENSEAYRTLKAAYSGLARQNFDLQKQVEELQGQLERYKLKFGALD